MSWQGVALSGEILHAMGDDNLVFFSQLLGDVEGGLTTNVVTALQGSAVSAASPEETEILVFTGGAWTPVSDSGGAGAAHDLLSATHGDTVASAVTRGSIIRGNSTPAWEEFALGTAEFVLFSNGTDVVYGRLGAPTPFSLGTSAAPSMTFTGDLDTGWSAEVANTLVGSANGSKLLTLDGVNTKLVLDGGQVVRDINQVGDYTILVSDYIVSMSQGAEVSVTMPATPTSGEIHIVKDAAGGAKSNNIVILGNGNNIDGNAQVVMKNNFASLTLMYNGTQWSIL